MEEQQEEKKHGFTVNEDLFKIPEVEDKNDYFSHIRNEDFVTFFGQLLSLRMEVNNYDYPYEEFLEDDGISDHIGRCNGILHMKLISILNYVKDKNGKYLSEDVIKNKSHYKWQELSKLIQPLIDKYLDEVKVNYINLHNTDIIFIPDFPGEVKNEYEYENENEDS